MKKLLSTIFLVAALCFATHSTSYGQHDTKIGAGIVYGSEVEAVGLQVNATFRMSPKIAIAPDVSFYFPDDENTSFYVDSYTAFNLNGHYMLQTDLEYHLYLLGGLNITSVGFETGDAVVDDSDSELGINFGLGGEYHLDSFSLYSELKYVFGVEQVVLGVGARLPIN